MDEGTSASNKFTWTSEGKDELSRGDSLASKCQVLDVTASEILGKELGC